MEALTCAADDLRGKELEEVIRKGGDVGRNLETHMQGLFTTSAEEGAPGEKRRPAGRNLKAHVQGRYQANTEVGTRVKQGDWYLFCCLVYDKDIPDFEDVQWPPSRDVWPHHYQKHCARPTATHCLQTRQAYGPYPRCS